MMHKRILLVGLLLLPLARLGAEAPSTALVQSVRGKAEFHRWGKTDLHPLLVGMQLSRGTTLKTGEGGAVTLKLPDGGHLGLNANSELTLGSLIPKHGRRSTLELVQGAVRWAVGRLAGTQSEDLDYELYTANAVAAVKGTDFTATYGADGSLTVQTWSTEHDGVEVGDPSGKWFLLAGAGVAVEREADGSLLERPLSAAEYSALETYEGFKQPQPPANLPKTPSDWQKGTPTGSPKGSAGLAAAQALLKGSGLAAADPKAAAALANLVKQGVLGITGLDRLLRQSEENQANAAKLAVLEAALGQIDKNPDLAKELAEGYRPDTALTQVLVADGLSSSLAAKIDAAIEKEALAPGPQGDAKGQLNLDPGKSKDLVTYIESSQGIKNNGVSSPLTNLDVQDALALQASTLSALAAATARIEAALEAAEKLGGPAGEAAEEAALKQLAAISGNLASEIAAQTGLDSKGLQGAPQGPAPQGTPGTTGQPGEKTPVPTPVAGTPQSNAQELITTITEQLAELKAEQAAAAKEEQQQRAQDLYNGTAFVDRHGYQVLEGQAVLRPDANTVQQVTTSKRSAGPDAGTSVFSVLYSYNQALPQDWTGIVGRGLNDPANLVNGTPSYYLVEKQETLLGPTGCNLCMTQQETPGSLGLTQLSPGSWGVPYTYSYVSGGSLLGQFSFTAAGSPVPAPPGTPTLQITAQPQADDSWLFTYSSSTAVGLGAPTVKTMFTAQVWLLDQAGNILPGGFIGNFPAVSLSDPSQGLASLSLLTAGTLNELSVSPATGGSVDVLVPNASFVGSF